MFFPMQKRKIKFNKHRPRILWFKEINNKDVPAVGGKNASLGEMYSQLTPKGIRVPNGFAITAYAYQDFIREAGIESRIKDILKGLDTRDISNLMTRGCQVRQTILKAKFPKELEKEIAVAYEKLSKGFKVKNLDVAVRSSATAEDLPNASFAGQQETFLNIRSKDALLKACKKCFASLFTNRAISYRVDKGFDHFKVFLSIGVQKMVRADKGSSGVMFTIDTESGFRDVVLINSIYGLGENIVQGRVTPDEFYVFKTTLLKGFKPIISKRLGDKKIKMIYGSALDDQPTKNVKVEESLRSRYSITDDEVLELAQWGLEIEEHYKKPMDIEWARDGADGQLYIVQARPETVHSIKNPNQLEEYRAEPAKAKLLVQGKSVGNKIGIGAVNVIQDVKGIQSFKKGEVLVTEMTNPDWEPIMKIASGIVTNSGGRTCHAAIVSRELGIPCIVGTDNATKVLKPAQIVTVDCSGGEQGYVYQGRVKFAVKRTNLKNLKKPETKIMMNLGNPEEAFRESFIPNDGVGLAREEFIISSYIGIHPLALLEFDKVKDEAERRQIEEKTQEYKSKPDFYVYELAEGIAQIAAAFYPKDVIVRFSDFKTNEYASLLGGKYFEPEESNPMIGWRGASRYYDPKFRPAFELECYALRRVREVMGLTNVKAMVPFCRTVEEGKKVLKIMQECGLRQGKDGLEVYVMCEIPANVVLASEFAKIFDGFSIGSNDLTQLTLGVDRDSEIVAHVYDERNKAVKDLIARVIKVARENNRKIGICGQAPSDFPDFAQFLVERGIDSISLTPDSVLKTTLKILETERNR